MDHFVQLENYMWEVFVRKEYVATIFFSLEKADETTWKYWIMRDLHDFRLKGRLPEFINNFLSYRTQQVCIEYIVWLKKPRGESSTREHIVYDPVQH